MPPEPALTRPGRPFPLGATWDGAGVNFALWSEHATGVELCLFDPAAPRREIRRVIVRERTDQVWHVYLPDARPGLLYGYRVDGPYAPEMGHRYNRAKVLLDPYARAISGAVRWSDAVYGYRRVDGDALAEPGGGDSAPDTPRGVVVDPAFDWGDERAPQTPWHETVIYEMHVKGFTARHPDIPAALRGSFAGLAHPAATAYLTRLGVTAVELLPVHHSVTEKRLVDLGLSNYWGYNSIGFFAPDSRLAASDDRGGQVAEFKTMVRALHEAGLEVILDVVYNHTAEGDAFGPTLCFRGMDNAAYYRLGEDRSLYLDVTGCGNTVNTLHPRSLGLIMDSLRYWVQQMHVDGFRFDLAAALGRGADRVDRFSPFFAVVAQDPVLSRVKLIAEPWDLGEGGYQVGNFPPGWAEWNGRYRDSVRRYWRSDEGQLPELGYRLTGSSDLYESSGRRPYASINFVTCHDGFTLADLVSYNDKHNLANGEHNLDGADDNFSWNAGVEGPTDDAEILELRERQMRNFLATLLLSQGVPMLSAGDEIGRTQGGNNNAYCQDSELSWLPWAHGGQAARRFAFTRALIRVRRDNPVFRRRTFLQGRRLHSGTHDLLWVRPDGKEMTEAEWTNSFGRCLGLMLRGDAIDEADERGVPVSCDTFLVLLNAHPETVSFVLPAHGSDTRWAAVLDTHCGETDDCGPEHSAGEPYDLRGRSLAVLRLRPEPGSREE